MVKLRKKANMGERGPRSRGTRFLPVAALAGPASGLVSMLLSNWKLAIFGIFIAVISYQNLMAFEILRPFGLRTVPGVLQEVEEVQEKADNQIRIMAEQLTECELSRERLKDDIAERNEEIQQWVDLSTQLQANQTQLSAALIELQKKSQQDVEIIIQGPIPQTCDGAIKFLKDAVTRGELKWNTSG